VAVTAVRYPRLCVAGLVLAAAVVLCSRGPVADLIWRLTAPPLVWP
jgi:hypothetical protein